MKIIYIFYLCDTAAVIMLINTHCALLNKASNMKSEHLTFQNNLMISVPFHTIHCKTVL